MTGDLLKAYAHHPFRVLGARPSDTRTSLIDRKADLLLFGDEKELDEALASLLNPQLRLRAELRWFPMTSDAEVSGLFARLVQAGAPELPRLQTESFLAQFNALRLALTRQLARSARELDAYLRALSIAADALLPRQVLEEINCDRRKAGFPAADDLGALEAGLEELFHETARVLVGDAPGMYGQEAFRTLGKNLEQAYRNTGSPYHNSYFLEIAAAELGA